MSPKEDLYGTKGGPSVKTRLGDFTLQAPDGQRLHARLLHRTADDISAELRRSLPTCGVKTRKW